MLLAKRFSGTNFKLTHDQENGTEERKLSPLEIAYKTTTSRLERQI